MRTVLVALTLVVAALAAPGYQPQYEPIFQDYHEEVGIAEAARIKAGEDAADFDGSRIVGGSFANLGQFPYTCGLVITLTNGATSVCGSSLLSNNRALTAAHCWRHGNSQARQFVVVCGSMTLFSGGTRITTTNVGVHASYNQNTLANDIAMINMNWVNFNNNIRAIPRATGNNQFVGNTGVASGFGRTSDSSGVGSNPRLSHVNLPIIANNVCQQTFGNIIIASTLCTSGAGGRSTCGGDSGGPLAVGNQLVGVTSFGSAAGCQRGFPAAFARVTAFNSWIAARM